MAMFKWKRHEAAEEPSAFQTTERRREHRVSLFIRPAKLVVDGVEYLCIVRDASQGGLRLQLFHDLPSGQIYEMEMSDGTRCPLRHVWSRGMFAGFGIYNPLKLSAFIEEVYEDDHRKRIRINRSINGTIHAEGTSAPVLLKNISQQGALIETGHHIAIDQLVWLETDALPSIYAKIRWRRAPQYGLIFEEVLQIPQLASCLGPGNPAKLI